LSAFLWGPVAIAWFVVTHLFGTFMSINPVCAAAAGWLMLGQALSIQELIGIGIIVLSNVVASRRVTSPAKGRRSVRAEIAVRFDGGTHSGPAVGPYRCRDALLGKALAKPSVIDA
jgi:hypothetical protein